MASKSTPPTCQDFPEQVEAFDKQSCVPDKYVRYCRNFNDHEICIDTLNTGFLLQGVRRTWALKGFVVPSDTKEAIPLSLWGADRTGFGESEAVSGTESVLNLLSDTKFLKTILKNAGIDTENDTQKPEIEVSKIGQHG